MSLLALAQTTTTSDVDHNLAQALDMVEQAAAAGASLLAFPEVFLFIGDRKTRLALAETIDPGPAAAGGGPLLGRFREAAAARGMHILLGSMYEKVPGNPERAYNTSVLLGPDGSVLARYRKINLFAVNLGELSIQESEVIMPGENLPPVVPTPLGRVGLTVCFDLRFPALFQHLARQGAEVIFVPSNFTAATGKAHWEVLLRARAVETQCWVAAPAQTGRHNPQYSSWGHTALVDPWGNITALAPEEPGLVYGEIDLEYLRRIRRELPLGLTAENSRRDG
ncbi:MAG: carbon-nitrogen hydrolase family protein [Deltaproteobacteria bacterium]|nr:carbon-nitrogen hydrolase family protein [Deltaproteobacteria bacterium]